MDFTDALKAGGASATLITIVGIIVKLMHSACGHRLRSECCGHQATVGVAVDNMPSPEKRPSLTIPEKIIVVDDKNHNLPPAPVRPTILLPPPVEPLERQIATGADA